MISLMSTNKVSDVIVSFLLEKGITTIFGIIGSANSHIYNSCAEAGIRILNTHNEQAALLAAGAYYRTSGKLALALVTAGGGATNAITGVVSLWADSIPALIISGQEKREYVETHSHRRMFGTQGFDVVQMVSKTTKYAKLVEENEIYNVLEHAYQTALTGRKGPVWLDIPFDVQSKQVPTKLWKQVSYEKLKPTAGDMEKVIDLIKHAQRPVILAG